MGEVVKTTPYTYGDTNWQDKLTSYDGDAIIYDEIGNPTNIGDKSYTWANGRQLAEYDDKNYRIEYTYNADGLRTMKKIYDKEKNVDTGEITEYLWRQYDYVWKEGVLDSAKITSYDEQTHELYNVISAKYLYDSENTPIGFIYTDPSDNTKNFKAWYVKNAARSLSPVLPLRNTVRLAGKKFIDSNPTIASAETVPNRLVSVGVCKR